MNWNKGLLLSFALTVFVHCKKNPFTLPPAEVTAGSDGRVSIVVDGEGYHPSTIKATAGKPMTLVFTRTSDEGCGQKLVFPALNIQRDLPLNQPVEVQVTPTKDNLAFTCGMNMYKGSVVVQ